MYSLNCDLCNGRVDVLSCNFAIFKNRELVRCRECKTVWRYPLPTEDELKEFYQAQKYFRYPDEIERTIGQRQYEYIHRILSNEVNNFEDLQFIEIGAGNGFLLETAKAQGHDVIGYEIDDNSVEICRKKGLDVRCQFFNEQVINDLEIDRQCVIIFSHVLEHLEDPVQLLRMISSKLTKSFVFIEVPDGSLEQKALIGDTRVIDSLQQHLWSFPILGVKALAGAGAISSLSVEKVGAPDYYSYTLFIQAFHKCLDDEVFKMKNSGQGFVKSISQMISICWHWAIKYVVFKFTVSGRKKFTRTELPSIRFLGKI